MTLAHRNNPDFLATRNNRRNASLELRSAYGALLPRLSANLSGQYQQGGQQFFSGVALGSNSDVMQSQYSVGVQYGVNAASFITPKVRRANSAAVDADIAGASENLTAVIKAGYLTALQSLAQAELQDSLVANAKVQLQLARAKAQVGTGTLLDVRRSEVALSQQQVASLQARNADINAAYLSLQTAQQTVALQQENATKARQELDFVQNEYAVGLATFIDLTTSRTAYAQAETDRINAVYNYHEAFAALESAVGQQLR